MREVRAILGTKKICALRYLFIGIKALKRRYMKEDLCILMSTRM